MVGTYDCSGSSCVLKYFFAGLCGERHERQAAGCGAAGSGVSAADAITAIGDYRPADPHVRSAR